jgi:hypothetical protein
VEVHSCIAGLALLAWVVMRVDGKFIGALSNLNYAMKMNAPATSKPSTNQYIVYSLLGSQRPSLWICLLLLYLLLHVRRLLALVIF